jgi:hypothetical protein
VGKSVLGGKYCGLTARLEIHKDGGGLQSSGLLGSAVAPLSCQPRPRARGMHVCDGAPPAPAVAPLCSLQHHPQLLRSKETLSSILYASHMMKNKKIQSFFIQVYHTTSLTTYSVVSRWVYSAISHESHQYKVLDPPSSNRVPEPPLRSPSNLPFLHQEPIPYASHSNFKRSAFLMSCTVTL